MRSLVINLALPVLTNYSRQIEQGFKREILTPLDNAGAVTAFAFVRAC